MCALRFPFAVLAVHYCLTHHAITLTELPKTDIRDIDNVVTLADGGFGVGAVRDGRAQRQNETTHVFVEGEEAHHLRRLLGCRQ
jgi:hypothetical protein